MIPLVEQIAQKIMTRLKAVSLFEEVKRPTRLGIQNPKDKTAVLLQLGGQELDDATRASGRKIGWIQQFAVLLYCVPSEKDTTAVDTQVNALVAACMAGLTDASNWGTWDGLAIESDLLGSEQFPDEMGDYDGAIVMFQVQFRTTESNPYEAA